MHHATFADRFDTSAGTRRIALVIVLVAAMLAALLPATTSAVADEHGFSDVSDDNVHLDNILRLSDSGVLEGFEDGTFGPGLPVTRGQLASIMARAAELEPAEAPYDFTDLDGNVHAGNIQVLADAGIIAGFEDGTFRPSMNVRRDQAASLMARWLGVAPQAEGPFTDVATDSVHAGAIAALNTIGVLRGTTDTTFEPAAPIERQQTASVVVRTLDTADAVELTLTVFHINDGESALLPTEEFPGAARFVADLTNLRDAAENAGSLSLTVSAGDNFLAGPRLNASLDDEDAFYDALVYTQGGFDVSAIGNHEFDFGPDVLADFMTATEDLPFVSANLDVSGEPVLAAFEDDGKLAASVVITKDGTDIGVVGATYEGLESISSPRNATTGPVLAAVQAEIDALSADGVGIILMASHLQNLDTELSLVPQLSGVDAVIGGGGGEALGESYPLMAMDADAAAVPVVTVPGNYTDVGRLVLNFDAEGDLVFVGAGSQLVPVDLDGPVDPVIVEQVESPVAAYVEALATNEIATTEVGLDGRRQEPGVRDRETNIGNLMTDAMLYSARLRADDFGVPEADVALQNGGGIRNDAVIPAGPVTELDTYNIAAFFNLVSVAQLDGTALRSALERSVSALPDPSGGHGQWAGVTFTYDLDAAAQVRDEDNTEILTEGERIVDAVVTLADDTEVVLVEDGVTVAPDELFTMASIDFLLAGQDGYVMFDADELTRLGVTYQQSLAEYLASLGTVTAEDYPDVSVDADTYTRFGPVGSFAIE